MVSELAANAVNASASPDGRPTQLDGRTPVIRVRLFVDKAVLVAEVWDEAGGVPARKIAGDADESGGGLALVHELTNACGAGITLPPAQESASGRSFPFPGYPGQRRTRRRKDSTDERHGKPAACSRLPPPATRA